METHFETVCGCKPTEECIHPSIPLRCSEPSPLSVRLRSSQGALSSGCEYRAPSPPAPLSSPGLSILLLPWRSAVPALARRCPCVQSAFGVRAELLGERQSPGTPRPGAVPIFPQLRVAFLPWIAGVKEPHLALGSCRRERHLHESRRAAAISAKLAETLAWALAIFLYLFAFAPSLPPCRGRLWAGCDAGSEAEFPQPPPSGWRLFSRQAGSLNSFGKVQ